MDKDEILNARQVAEQNPELNTIREQLFGENYLQDIDQGTGIAQYYTGFGQMPTLNYTPPVVEEAEPAVDVTQPIVDTGGGGGGAGISTGNETGNTDFEQNLLDQGIGVQAEPGAPISAPGEGMLTQLAIDDLANYPRNTEFDPNALEQDIADVATNTSQAEFDALAEGLPPDVDIDSMYPDQVPEEFETEGMTPMDVKEQYGAQGQYEGYVNPADVEAGLATESMFDTPEQTNAINEAFNSVKDLGEAGVGKLRDSLVALGGKVKEGFDNTVEIGGKTIDLGKSLLGGAISLATGIPGVGFLLNAVQPDPVDAATKTGLQEQGYEFDDIGRLTTGPMAGYSVESAFGDGIADATLDRIDKIENRDAPQTEDSIEKVEELYDFLGDVTEVKAAETAPQEDIGAISGDMNTGADPVSGDLPGGGNIGDEFGSGGDTQATTGPTVSRSDADYGQFGRAQSAQAGGGGNQGGGGKIVCTMMNDSYGFGSFRNKIWLKHSKDLAPEYQIGYHKIFLPLVKLSKTNKVVKKVLEHIAVHRTIDIRQEARGKVHLLGRIYRKILEPICYIVGKHAKR